MVVLNDINDIRNEISNGNVCLKFSADWCGPCSVLSSVIEKIEDNYNNVKFIEIDIDDVDDSIIEEYQIRNIPVLYFIKDGTILNKIVGSVKQEVLVDELNKY